MDKFKKTIERIAMVLLYLSVLLVPLIGVVAIPKTLQIFLVIAMLFCLCTFFWLLLERKLWKMIKQGLWYAVFFTIVLVISTVKYGISLVNQQGITFFTVYQMVIFAAYGYMAFAFIATHKRVMPVLIGILSFTFSLLTLVNRSRYMLDLGVYRFIAAYSSPNILGIFSVLAFFCSLYLLASHQPLKTLHLINGALAVAATVLTGSRSAIIAMVVGGVIFAAFSLITVRIRKLKPLAVAGLLFLVFTVVFVLVLKPSNSRELSLTVVYDAEAVAATEETVSSDSLEESAEGGVSQESAQHNAVTNDNWERFLKRFSLYGDGASSIKNNLRLHIWLEYLRYLPDYVLFGTDYTLTARPVIEGFGRDTHNTLLYTLFRFGVFGLVALMAMLIVIVFKLFFRRKKTPEQIAILSMFAALLLISMLIDLLNVAVFYLILAFAYAAVVDTERVPSKDANSPERTLQVFSSLNKGGAETRTMVFMRSVDPKNIGVDFAVTSANAQQHYYYDEIISLGGKVYEIHSWKQVGFVEYFAQWTRLLRENQYQIVHCHAGLFSAVPMYVAWLNDIPMRIVHAHDSSADNGSKLVLRINKIITNLFANRRIYCSTEAAVFAFGEKNLHRAGSYFLPNGVDFHAYSELTPAQRVGVKRDLKLPEHSFVVGTVGNARPVKNHIFLVKAFHKLLERDPMAVLVIAGRNEQDVEAKQYVEENGIGGRVIFAGSQDNIPSFLQILDLFVLPSFNEGAPVSVIEAQAANVPCILSDTITRDVDVGTGFVKYLSLDAPLDTWAEQMYESCTRKRPAFGKTIQKLEQAGYDAAGSAKMLMEIYGISM